MRVAASVNRGWAAVRLTAWITEAWSLPNSRAIAGCDKPNARADDMATARASLTGRLRWVLMMASGSTPNIFAAMVVAGSHTAAGPVASALGIDSSTCAARIATSARSCSRSKGETSWSTVSCSPRPAACRIKPARRRPPSSSPATAASGALIAAERRRRPPTP